MITGDFSALEALGNLLEGPLSAESTISELSNRLGNKAMELVQHGFDTESDPSGQHWAPHSPNSHRTNPILTDTGLMRELFTLSTSAEGFTITNYASYSQYHQEGTVNLPIRQMLPEGDLSGWESDLRQIAEDFWIQKFK